MSSVQKIFMVSLVFFFLTACGLKGDLYLPEQEPQVVESPTTEQAETSEAESLEEEIFSQDSIAPGTEIVLTPEEKQQMQKEQQELKKEPMP